jgi:transcriptional regulator with XRE-family HTH domain
MHGHLLWEVACITACPVHRVQLVPSECGAPRDKYLSKGRRKNLPGVCSTCGSIGYRCMEGTTAMASEVEVWKAQQVAELIACFPCASRLFSRQNTIDGLTLLIAKFADGKKARAARQAGMAKSLLQGWLQGDHIPSLGPLLNLCLAAGVSLVSVMKGSPVECASPPFQIRPSKRRTKKVTREALEKALKEALLVAPPQSLSAIASALGADPHSVRKQFPNLSTNIIERFRQFKLRKTAERHRKAMEEGQKLIEELSARRLPLTHRNFQALSGKPIMPNDPLRPILKEAIAHRGSISNLPNQEFPKVHRSQ